MFGGRNPWKRRLIVLYYQCRAWSFSTALNFDIPGSRHLRKKCAYINNVYPFLVTTIAAAPSAFRAHSSRLRFGPIVWNGHAQRLQLKMSQSLKKLIITRAISPLNSRLRPNRMACVARQADDTSLELTSGRKPLPAAQQSLVASKNQTKSLDTCSLETLWFCIWAVVQWAYAFGMYGDLRNEIFCRTSFDAKASSALSTNSFGLSEDTESPPTTTTTL